MRRLESGVAVVAILQSAALFSGCATPEVRPVELAEVREAPLVSFIRDGATTREEVLLRLGTPAASFENDRILAYQIRSREDGTLAVFWPRRLELDLPLNYTSPEIYSLILVFDARGVVVRHSLVGAR